MFSILQLDQSSDYSYNADFAENFASLTSSCGATGFYYVTPTTIAFNGSSTTAATATATLTPSCASTYTIQAGDTCNGICKSYNVSTHALLTTNHLKAYCKDFPEAGKEPCLPPSCDIYTVSDNDTCQSVAAKEPGYITITQLQAWNPNLNTLCTT
jgi:LysM repeat protein